MQEEKEEFQMGLPNGVGEAMLAHAYEKFDIKLEQTEFGPVLIGEYDELVKTKEFLANAIQERLNELEGKTSENKNEWIKLRVSISLLIHQFSHFFMIIYFFNSVSDLIHNHDMQSGQIPRYGATAFLISEDTLFTPLLASIISWV